MEFSVTDDSKFKFAIEDQLEQQIGIKGLPFSKMDKSRAAMCIWNLKSICKLDVLCPFRHMNDHSTIVCKHYLNGLCKKGDYCEFLHQYDMSKMPECYFYAKFGECQNEDCQYIHSRPIVENCAWYNRGFCVYGPACKLNHERKIACKNYINGFCPDGGACKFAHPRWLPLPSENKESYKQKWVCRYCNEPGHKIQFCRKLPSEERDKIRDNLQMKNSQGFPKLEQLDHFGSPKKRGTLRPLSEITCYKCGEKGHYANNCKTNNFNFLRNQT